MPEYHPSPADWRDLWVYFLLVDRFDNPAAPPRQPPWDSEHGGFQGGTLAGVRARLDYLAELGAGALWLSPVLRNPQWDEGAYHGYGVQDFLAVDPRLASEPAAARRNPAIAEGELRQLVDDAHARDLYVILDVVLNHTGDVFDYEGFGAEAPWRDGPYPIRWRDAEGLPRPEWAEAPSDARRDAAVWPTELRRNEYFRRRGNAFSRPGELSEAAGDFFSLKELVTDWSAEGAFPVRDALISAYQQLIARYDVDGFRIDTLKYLEPDFARTFGNAMREYALSIGKRNFFTFGEVYDSEEKIARFIGRQASEPGDLVGVDAALDFPLFYVLPSVAKGLASPAAVVGTFEHRKSVQRGLVSSHGEASRFFVTFLDNHDQHARFRHEDPTNPTRFDDQVTLGLACLLTLQGIPCLYYGTEQGLHGGGGRPEAVREALWGKRGAFDLAHPAAAALRSVGELRRREPALRYGRQYFRPLSGDGVHYGISPYPGGVLAYSRLLYDREVLVAANTSTEAGWTGEIVLDRHLNPAGTRYSVLYTNAAGAAAPPMAVIERVGVEVDEPNGARGSGPLSVLRVTLRPMEAQILGPV